jgi:hypothetical protein
MAFLTTSCDACQWPKLLDDRQARSGRLTCPECGSPAHVIPGCSFHADDQALFNDLCQIVHEGGLSPAESRALSRCVDDALRTGSSTRLVMELTQRLPGLIPLQAGTGAKQSANRRLLLLLRAILDAGARGRSTPPPALEST